MSATNYTEKRILKHLVRGETLAVFTPYLGLSTTDPGETGNVTEPFAVNAYARVSLLGSTPAFSTVDIDAATGTVTNANAVTFPKATAPWGSVSHWFIADSQQGGNVLSYGILTTPKTITTDERLVFPAASITLTVN